ncbi:MAG: InlB B-repeat-containing protein [Eubacteriales bacterium]|nr:InlB B-repeat-containing protein [Eubacteriales bacterium]
MEDRSQKRELKGIYRNVKISVRALDMMILGSIALILLVLALELRSPGLTVSFDSKGGTDVAAVTQQYGELLQEPEPPTREGYRFTGWYTDRSCDDAWDLELDTVRGNLTLYAGWEEK